MAQLTVPNAPKEYATRYRELLGVDYQADQTEVDRRRSPDMVNLISDFGGNPVKRDGYRKVGANYAGIVMIDGEMWGARKDATNGLVVAKLSLQGYELNEDLVYYVSNLAHLGDIGTVKSVLTHRQKMYIFATKATICFDKTHAFHSAVAGVGTRMMSNGVVGESEPVWSDNIPLTLIGMNPDGTGGTALYDKNIMSIYQQVSYRGDGTSTQFKIPTYKKIGTWVKAEVKNANGDWQEVNCTLGTPSTVTGRAIDRSSHVQSQVVDPTVTLATAPSAPAVSGEDNVRITFAPYSMEVYLQIDSDTIYVGYYNDAFYNSLLNSANTFQENRLFVADKHRVYYSSVSDPLMIPDLSYFEVDGEIVCFTRSANHLGVVTKDDGGNTIYLATEQTRTVDSQTGATETYYIAKPSNSGIGAIAPKCSASLSDEPLFLSGTGVYGLLTNYLSEKYAVNRSTRINRKLCREPNLESAVGASFNDYFYLAINTHMYVLDGRRKESDRAGNKPFEAYYFEGLPAIENMSVVGDKMFFSDDENTYTWNSDLVDAERYYDNAYAKEAVTVKYQLSTSRTEPPTGEWVDEAPTPAEGEYLWYQATYDDESVEETLAAVAVGDKKLTGEPVRARWCSVYDDDGAPQKLKTLMKKGTMITLVPHYHSGCEITLVKDGDLYEYLGSFDADMHSFEHIDFTRFSFSANAVAFDHFTKKKIKKYKRLQIQVENNKAEPFGLTQITKTYTFGNYAKR